jgi:uncharacterized protein (DUF2336 family)
MMAKPKANESLIVELERVTHGGSPERCAETMRRVTDLFLTGAERYSEDQVLLFENVLGLLVERIERRAREELSTRLALVDNAPIRVIQRLAQDDEIAVAESVLRQSSRLSDNDLIEIASTKSQGHLLAISERQKINPAVTDVLLDRGNREVIHKLAHNAGASFSESGFTTLVLKAEADERLAETVGLRLDVPSHLFQKLLTQASKTVRNRLLALAPPATQREIRRVLATVSKEIGWEATAPRDFARAQERVQAIQERGELNEATLGELARLHRYDDLVVALSLLCAAPIDVIDPLLGSPRDDGILVPCRAAKLSWPTVDAILQHRGMHQALTAFDRAKLQADYARLSQATAQRLLGFWQAQSSLARH